MLSNPMPLEGLRLLPRDWRVTLLERGEDLETLLGDKVVDVLSGGFGVHREVLLQKAKGKTAFGGVELDPGVGSNNGLKDLALIWGDERRRFSTKH